MPAIGLLGRDHFRNADHYFDYIWSLRYGYTNRKKDDPVYQEYEKCLDMTLRQLRRDQRKLDLQYKHENRVQELQRSPQRVARMDAARDRSRAAKQRWKLQCEELGAER